MKSLEKKPGKIAAVVMLAVYLLPGFVCADDMVLCVAEDGRISFEKAEEGRCVNSHDDPCTETQEETPGTCLWSPRGCCGSCLDIPILLSSPHAQQIPVAGDLSAGPAPAVSFCRTADIITDDPPADCAETRYVKPVARSALTILRTVVIII